MSNFLLYFRINFLYPEVIVHFDDQRPEFIPYGLTCERWTPEHGQAIAEIAAVADKLQVFEDADIPFLASSAPSTVKSILNQKVQKSRLRRLMNNSGLGLAGLPAHHLQYSSVNSPRAFGPSRGP